MSAYLDWTEKKSELAHALGNGCCGGSYEEGAIILCACISAMASLMWVKTNRTDGKRFAQIVTMFSDSQHDTKTISAPLLAQDNDDWKPRLNVSDKSFWYTGYIDKTESEVLALLGASPPSDCKKFIRKYSYANILYEDVRCGFVHTYSPTDRASIDDATREIFDAGSSQISYKNTPMQKGFRKIYFPLEWIAAVAKSVARGMDSECARNNKHCFENVGLSTPTLWWLDGA